MCDFDERRGVGPTCHRVTEIPRDQAVEYLLSRSLLLKYQNTRARKKSKRQREGSYTQDVLMGEGVQSTA